MVEVMTDPATIAKSLSARQKEALLSARWIHQGGVPPIALVDFTDPWPAPIAQFFTMKQDRLNDIGLAVRAILQEEQK